MWAENTILQLMLSIIIYLRFFRSENERNREKATKEHVFVSMRIITKTLLIRYKSVTKAQAMDDMRKMFRDISNGG